MPTTVIPHSTKQIVFPSSVLMNISTVNDQIIIDAPSDVSLVVNDQNILRQTSSSVRTNMQIGAAVSKGGPVTFASEDVSKATVSSSGYVTQVGSGVVGIFCRSQWVDKRVQFTAAPPAPTVIDTWQSYIIGSLGKAIHDAINTRVATSNDRNVFSSINHATASYTRNTSCWVTADKTCWPAWNSYTGSVAFSGAAITPKHLVCAWHATPPVGTTVRFLTNGNVVVTRTITAITYFAPADLQIVELDTALPGTITPAKVLPTNWNTKFTLGNIPIVCANQSSQLYVSDWIRIGNGGYSVQHQQTTDPSKSAVNGVVVSGDSGSPGFVVINNELVVLGCHHTNSPQLISFISLYLTEINAAIASSGYSLNQIDLSGYPSYP